MYNYAFVAMSGGVDSSVAASMMMKRGFETVGLTLVMQPQDTRAADDAAKICRALGIDHVAIDASAAFDAYVAGAFADAYAKGLTPNPCVECNRRVKFPLVFDAAEKYARGRDFFVVTGHYAKIGQTSDNGCMSAAPDGSVPTLMRAADLRKDQSYVLWGIDEKYLRRLMFPLGCVLSKDEVRAAAEIDVPDAAKRSDSQDICFIPEGDYAAWMTARGFDSPPGDYIDANGAAIGRHLGHIHYTVGQRKRLGVAFGHPVFVQAKDAASNTVTLGESDGLYKSTVTAADVKIFTYADNLCNSGDRITAKIRYAGQPSAAEVTAFGDGRITLAFDEPVRAPTPGQSLVMYTPDGETICGGGYII